MTVFLPPRLTKRARDQWLSAQSQRKGNRAFGVPLRERPGSVLQWSSTTPERAA